MEAKFLTTSLTQHNERLKDTVQFIPIKCATDEFLETEISEDRLLVIDQESSYPDAIEIVFRVNPLALRVAGICLNIANTPKCEVNLGASLEYDSVVRGTKQDDMPELDVYKYEFNWAKRLPSLISLSFKPKSAEVLIFGIDVFVCPATAEEASSSTGSIDLSKVEDMLAKSNLGISEAAERCKEFLKVSLVPNKGPGGLNIPSTTTETISLIDQRLADMETRIMSQMDQRFKTLELNQERHFRLIMERLDSNNPF